MKKKFHHLISDLHEFLGLHLEFPVGSPGFREYLTPPYKAISASHGDDEADYDDLDDSVSDYGGEMMI